MPVGTLISVWEYFVPEVLWELKSDDPENDPWLFGEEEFRKILSILAMAFNPEHLDYKKVWEALNKEKDSRIVLKEIPVDLIETEALLLKAIVNVYFNLRNEMTPTEVGVKASDKYAQLLQKFFKKFYLRYSLREPFEIIINIESIFSDLYGEINRISRLDPGTKELLQDFEEEISELLREVKTRKAKTVISKASNFVELFLARGKGIAPKPFSGILREDCDREFPHADFEAMAVKLYGFSCDFIGVRHGGGRKPMLRKIELRDALVGALLYLLLAGHLHPDINQDTLLKV